MDKLLAGQADSVNRVIEAYITTSLKQAQEAFEERPSATNWTRALQAMVVYQQLKMMGQPKLSSLPEAIWPLPIGSWAEAVVAHASGRSISQCLNEE